MSFLLIEFHLQNDASYINFSVGNLERMIQILSHGRRNPGHFVLNFW